MGNEATLPIPDPCARAGSRHHRAVSGRRRIMRDGLREVIVDSEKVGRCRDRGEIAARDARCIGAAERPDVGGITASVQRIEEPAVPQAVVASCGRDVIRAVARTLVRMKAERDATRASSHFRAQHGTARPAKAHVVTGRSAPLIFSGPGRANPRNSEDCVHQGSLWTVRLRTVSRAACSPGRRDANS